jgi:hypothetical protein
MPSVRWNPPPPRPGAPAPDPEEWSEEHCKVLYLVSLYASAARTPEQREGWVRETPLLVLIFEGITSGVLDFDYAPASVLLSHQGVSKRRWLNVSQEGKAAVEDMREAGMVKGLKLSTEDFQPVTAVQVSQKGLAFLLAVPPSLKAAVDSFTFPPAAGNLPRERVGVQLVDSTFRLFTPGGFSKESAVTETEDVSYVSSPYLPPAVRRRDVPGAPPMRAMSCNAHRASESALGGSTIADELSEAIVLSNVHCLVGEWVPFGSNQIVSLNDRLGALDRCQGGLFTALIDKDPTQTQFKVAPGLTQVRILDFDFVHFINFEAEINFPEDDGIVQVENFGIHVNVDGTCVYGLKVEAILDRSADDISLDHLSRLLVDLHQDSSQIMSDLLSQYQRSLLDLVFLGDMNMRNKFNVILAERISPQQAGDLFMDKGEFENELKQVIGDLRGCHDLGNGNIIVLGRDGILCAGRDMLAHDKLLIAYLSLLSREVFLRSYFVRMFILDDLLKRIRLLLLDHHADPNSLAKVRGMLNQASRDIILLQEILAYLRESLVEMEDMEVPADHGGKRLFKVLSVGTMRRDILMRCVDLNKLCEGTASQLTTLQQMTDVINTKQLEEVFDNVNANTKYLVDASAANERSSASLEVMQVICAGSFAFDIVDRLSGGTLNIVVPAWVEDLIVKPFISQPFLWWCVAVRASERARDGRQRCSRAGARAACRQPSD